MADEFKGDRPSTPDEEDRFLAEIIPHTLWHSVIVRSTMCEGEPFESLGGDCACGALRRRELARWGLQSAGAAGRIKVYERIAEVADGRPGGVLGLTGAQAREMVAVAQHQIAHFTLDKPEWLRKKLEALGLAG